jgi:hypothetical protein
VKPSPAGTEVGRAAAELAAQRRRAYSVSSATSASSASSMARAAAQLVGELGEDALHLLQLGRLQLADAVAELDRRGGSTKTVAPVLDASCTMPPTSPRPPRAPGSRSGRCAR